MLGSEVVECEVLDDYRTGDDDALNLTAGNVHCALIDIREQQDVHVDFRLGLLWIIQVDRERIIGAVRKGLRFGQADISGNAFTPSADGE